jgi:PAS domain S-box-containing protein
VIVRVLPQLVRLRLRFLVALAAAAVLTVAGDAALRDTLALQLGDPRVHAVASEQRLLAERIARTADRLAAAPPAERSTLREILEESLARTSELQGAFRSVDAPAGAGRLPAPQRLPEWRALETAQDRLRERSEALARRAAAAPPAPREDLAAAASEVRDTASASVAAGERWLQAAERQRSALLQHQRRVHRALAGGALGALAGAWLLAFEPALRGLRRRAEQGDDARYRTLVERCPNAVVVAVDGWLAYVNPAATALWRADGPAALVGTPAYGLFHPDDREAARARLDEAERGRTFRRPLEFRLLRLDETEARGLLHLAPVVHEGSRGVEMIFVDVTEQRGEEERRRALETRVRAAERVESLALMAGGVAHDFSNLLTAIIANAEMLRLLVRDDRVQTATVEEVLTAANTASELVEQLLTYAGGGVIHPEPVELGELVAETLRLLRRRIRDGVELRLLADPDAPPVRGDRAQLRQIVMNLVLNAAEAIVGPSGQVEVRVRRMHLDRDFFEGGEHDPDVGPGDYVMLEVADDGTGMDAATRARIFDPFFSRRRPGRGLGLAAVLGIVRRHRGAIAVESEPGNGSLFRVALPPAR